MNNGMKLALVLTIAATAAALILTAPEKRFADELPSPNDSNRGNKADLSTGADAQPSSDLPSGAALLQIPPAARDVFASTGPAPPPPPTPIIAQASLPALLPAFQPPKFEFRYSGTLRTPDGTRLVYLAQGDDAFAVQLGSTLPGGFVVQALTDDELVLSSPTSGDKVIVALARSDAQ